MMFPEHGYYIVSLIDNMLVVVVQGSFNEEGALDLNRKIVSTIELNNPKDWVRFDVFKDRSTLGTLEAQRHLVENFRHSRANGCKAVFIIGANNSALHALSKACDEVGLIYASFEDISHYVKANAAIIDFIDINLKK